MNSYPSLGPLSKHLADYPWPGNFFQPDDLSGFLDAVYVLDYRVDASASGLSSVLRLAFEGELAIALPGFEGVKLVFGGGDIAGVTFVTAVLRVGEQTYLELQDIRLSLRFDPSILKPAPTDGAEVTEFVEIRTSGFLRIDDSFEMTSNGFQDLELTPAMIGDSGVVVSAKGVKIHLSRTTTAPWITAAGFDESFMGVFIGEAAVKLPPGLPALAPSDLFIKNCAIGSGGFSGKLEADYPGQGEPSAIFGIPFRLKHVLLELRQNAFAQSEILGEMLLPFFDNWAEVEIGLDLGGGFHVRLADADGDGLKKVDTQAFSMQLDSVAFEVNDGVFIAKVAGKLTPTFGGLNWPTFDVKELSIDSKGHVHLEGGWLNLPEQKTFNFYGFKIEITQLGFGNTDDGGKWIGFSGGVHLVDGLPQGASVEGLRITWYEDGSDPKITLNGAGIELLIPEVLYFKGSVSYREIKDSSGNAVHRFDGDISLTLAIPDLTIDGTLVIGSVNGPQGRYNFFAIYVDADLPTGIPLASTGLEISGFAGLFALQMEPNKTPAELWYSIDRSKSFYHRAPLGITDLRNKWEPRKGSFALGAGVELRTLADNGYTFNGNFFLAIVNPGPIVLLTGAAQFLKKQKDGNDEGQFRAIAVLDGRRGSLLIGLDAQYKNGTGGELIEIGGSMEAFFAFHDPTAWQLWLGQNEPRSLRIRALLGQFAEANAYFMLDAHQLALGAWFGYNNDWKFGPLSIRLEAWAEGNALLSFKPTHFHGDLWLHCLVELNVFGVGLGIAMDAQIAADLFRPYHLRGEFSVGIKLPFKKKKIGAKVVLEWGPRLIAPPLPLPLAQVSAESLKTTVVWTLPRKQFLLPNWDDGNGFLAASPTGLSQPVDLTSLPLVPLDAHIAITFGRSVHDDALVGVNLQPIIPAYEEIGHPGGGAIANVRYALTSLELSRWDGATWQLVAKSPQSGLTPKIFGSWMPVPKLPDGNAQPQRLGQTKLLVGVKSPFVFARATGSSWVEWVSDALPEYPCIAVQQAVETCFGFDALAAGTQVTSPWSRPGPPGFTLFWGFGPATVRAGRVPGTSRVINSLCFPEAAARRGVRLTCLEPGRSFRIVLAAPALPATSTGLVGRGKVGAALIQSVSAARRICVDLRDQAAGTLTNPLSKGNVRFVVYGADGERLHHTRVERWERGALGLNAGFRLEIALPCASSWVELLVTHRPPFRVVAFNGRGEAVATHVPTGAGTQVTETIRLEGPDIARLEVHAAGNEKLVHSVCYACPTRTGPSGTGHDVKGNMVGPFFPEKGAIVVVGTEITEVVLTGDGPLCIERICITPDPEAGQALHRKEMIEHMTGELSRWESEGTVLAPNTVYRMTVRTQVQPQVQPKYLIAGLAFPAVIDPEEHAYFRTEGPPGVTKLKAPESAAPGEPFDSGLDDLVRYVRETDPPTVPPQGQKPIRFRPFYRAYDVGVEFNEDYVEQMYRMDRRDLGLYLYDNNNQPVRDAKGRLIAGTNGWGKAEKHTLSEKDTRWVTLLDSARCLQQKLDPVSFPRASVLASADSNLVLAPDTLHEARLVPLLLHESFAEAALAGPGAPPGWYVEDTGADGPSAWQLGEIGEPPGRFVEQVSAIGEIALRRAGTLLLLADPQLPQGDAARPSEWTNYRVSVHVQSQAGGAVGLVMRHRGPGTGYRFSLDDSGRRLVKLGAGLTFLAEDHFVYQKKRDYRLTVEVLGTMLRAYVDGEPVFEVTDSEYGRGRVGLYACQSAGARFSDVAIDDLRTGAPVAYRFEFITSLFTNFYHHLHSFQDETWTAQLASGPAVDALLAEARAPDFSVPNEAEARAYDELVTMALGPPGRQNPDRVEITRVERDGRPALFLLRSPEPLAASRVDVALSQAMRLLPAGAAPGDLKLVEVTRGAVNPEGEAITLLLRDAAELTRRRIEMLQLPGPLAELTGDPLLWLETFRDQRALDRFTVVDIATSVSASNWQVESGGLLEVSGIGGGNEPELPGSHALFGDGEWQDYRITVDLRADAGGDVGVLVRYRDADNYYRFSVGAVLPYRRLVKCVDGATILLWEDLQGYFAGEPFQLAVEVIGTRLVGFVGNAAVFDVHDGAHAGGRVGLYASANPGVRCERIEVRRPSLERKAWLTDRFAQNDLSGWFLVSEDLTVPLEQSAAWATSGDALNLTSLLAAGNDPGFPGAYAVAGDAAWTDVILQVRLRSSGGAIGVVVRGKGFADFYRFSMCRDLQYRQLIKKVGGTVTVLWRDAVAYEPGRTYELTFVAIGASLRGYLDGVPLFAVEDGDVPTGVIALYAWNNNAASFTDVRVWPGEQAFDRWLLNEPFTSLIPDRWSFFDDASAPESDWWKVAGGELRPTSAATIGTGAGSNSSDTPAMSERSKGVPQPPPVLPVVRSHYAIAAQPEATEFRLTVRLRLGADAAAGIVFGWRDATHHLALWIDSHGGRWLTKVEGALQELLWSDAVRPDPSHAQLIVIDHWMGRLTGHVDGVQVFSIDATPVAGRVGLAARGAGVHFQELLLGFPEWTCWYAFGDEELLPAGTRVRLHSGAVNGASTEAGLVVRSSAMPGERGRFRLPADVLALRVVEADGRIGHARSFLPDGTYVPVGLRVLRKADGTGIFLLPDEDGSSATGAMRLKLNYDRSRMEAGRRSSQAGDRGSEHVTLDFGVTAVLPA